MQRFMFVKKFVMPCGLCIGVPVVRAEHQSPEQCTGSNTGRMLVRPSELPIYSSDDVHSKEILCSDDDRPPSALEQQFATIRKSLQSIIGTYQTFSDNVSGTINTGLGHSEFLLGYLREEENTLPRIGAIGIGGLTGLIFGLRGGIIRRFIYSTTGCLAVGAVCYPKAAQETFDYAKHYANVSYNFIYGVKPGEEKKLDFKLPEMLNFKTPTSWDEFFQLTVDTGITAATTVTNLAEKAIEFVKEKKEEISPSKVESEDKHKAD